MSQVNKPSKFLDDVMAAETSNMAGTAAQQPFTLADMGKILREVAAMPKPNLWLVADPWGRIYTGSAEQMLAVLMPHHPLLKMKVDPFEEGY